MPEEKDVSQDKNQYVIKIVNDEEVTIAKTNDQEYNDEFESLVDMLECKRSEKDYDWMSDNFLPELPSILLTDASDWANQYFQTRSFIEVNLEGDNPDDKVKCEAAKKLINKTLNNREVFHYHKYIRARLINALRGNVYIQCWWEQKRKNEVIGVDLVEKELDIDIHGNQIVDPMIQIPATQQEEQPRIDNTIIYDRFNYDVLDPRNVFSDFKYAYSAQHKDWITIRTEKSYPDLLMQEDENGYFNLDDVKKLNAELITDTEQESYNKTENRQHIDKSPVGYFDVYERFGKFWCKVTEKDEGGRPLSAEPGFNDDGTLSEEAELIETIIAWVVHGGTKVLIRFQPTPFIDAYGNTYKPIVRGWCYIHPTKDLGLSDGKYGRELQAAINDTFNMSNDKVKLSTLPTLKGKRTSLMDNDTVYFEPEHIIELDDPADLVEFKIDPDVGAALGQISMLRSYMQQITAKFPTTMGELPSQSNITATAVSQTGDRASTRNNYKSLTMEHTFLIEFYWMIIQMTAQFMQKETAEMVFGKLIQGFDPKADYTYAPVTSSIETEQNKYRKLQLIDQFIGRVASIPNPNTPKLLNYLLMKSFELFGDEFPDFKQNLLDEKTPPPDTPGTNGNAAPNNQEDMKDSPVSNQQGIPMGSAEMNARNQATGANIG